MSNAKQKMNGKPHAKNAKGTAIRLLGYIAKNYKLKFSIVCLCILIASATSVASSLFIKTVISDFIEPMLYLQRVLLPSIYTIYLWFIFLKVF